MLWREHFLWNVIQILYEPFIFGSWLITISKTVMQAMAYFFSSAFRLYLCLCLITVQSFNLLELFWIHIQVERNQSNFILSLVCKNKQVSLVINLDTRDITILQRIKLSAGILYFNNLVVETSFLTGIKNIKIICFNPATTDQAMLQSISKTMIIV